MVRIITKAIYLTVMGGALFYSPGPLPVFAGNAMVVIDAGHGGYDTGIIAAGLKEKDIALNIAKALKAALEEGDERSVWLTRKMDQYASIEERRKEANSVSPGMLLSLHLSHSDRLAIYITWYLKGDSKLSLQEYYSVSSAQRRYLFESKALSRAMGQALSGQLEVSVAYREMPLELLNSIGAPAIMVELPSDGLDFDERRGEIVSAIVRGIKAYEQGR